jgi:hypothetical protein
MNSASGDQVTVCHSSVLAFYFLQPAENKDEDKNKKQFFVCLRSIQKERRLSLWLRTLTNPASDEIVTFLLLHLQTETFKPLL